jgi:prevent-host-death family protein
MEKVNVQEAKTHFSRLLDRAQQGEEFVITKAGRPVARLGPFAHQGKKRRLGLLDGKFRIPDDFNEPGCRRSLPPSSVSTRNAARPRSPC